MPTLTPAAAQAIQDEIAAAEGWVMWFVHRDETGRYVARATVADTAGGHDRGELSADTLDELRAMLPQGLTRGEPGPFDRPGVVEVWD